MQKATKYLKDQIYESLLDELFSHKIRMGDYIIETEISKKYNASRTPVREALMRLCHEGFLSNMPKGGYIVNNVSYKDIIEYYDIRFLLEGYAGEKAAERITEEELMELEKFTFHPTKGDSYDFNKEFHMIIARASGNKKLAQQIDDIIEKTKMIYMIDPLVTGDAHDDENIHLEIFTAIKNHEPLLAKKLVEDHIIFTKKRIMEELLK